MLSCSSPRSSPNRLRGQVENMLQMVEEEAEISKISFGKMPNFFHVDGFINSPMSVVAPTPANTPVMDLSENELLPLVTASPVDDKFIISQEGKKKHESLEFEASGSNITRSLLLDFCDKSESLAVLTYQEEEIDELCEAISSINVNGGGQRNVKKFAGKHTKFVYNSDDEIKGVEERDEFAASAGVLRLKGDYLLLKVCSPLDGMKLLILFCVEVNRTLCRSAGDTGIFGSTCK
ncbi:putative chaperone protein dnaJ 11, chloroplastic-like [Capsicum annuum]|nr:putative chaperone protein dnaJ 11, chloroplastic-like [Capsicum annuum]